MSQDHTIRPGTSRWVRRRFWWLMTIVVLVAFTGPMLALWHANALPLLARACLWPQAPHVGQTTWLVVTVPDERDQAATAGPWAQATVAWDMPAMAMRTRAVSIQGSTQRLGVFAAPLALTMAGAWWARVALATPGRPVWQVDLRFTVRPAQTIAHAAPATQATGAIGACSAHAPVTPQLDGA